MKPIIDPARVDRAEVVTSEAAPVQPQPLVREIPAGLPYPVAALGPFRAAVEAVQAKTQAPIAIPAQSALAVAALALQGFANVETLGGYRPLSLYCLTLAFSGERKSSCDTPLMETMRAHEQEQMAIHAEARKDWEIDFAIWKARHERVLADVRKGKADRKDLAAIGPEPAPPALPDRLVAEPTYEGLARLFHLGQPSLGLFSDEGGQFLGGFAMSKDHRQKTLAALNGLWMGDAIKRTRQGDGAFTLYGRRLSLHLLVQPGVGHELLGDPLAADTGFLPRCLICEPSSTVGTRFHATSRDEPRPLGAFGARLEQILQTAMPMVSDTRELRPRQLPLSPEAKAKLIEFSDNVERAQAPGGDMETVRGFASKSAEQAARIAGVLELWRDLQAEAVSPQSMGWGIELARFYLLEAQRLAGTASLSPPIRDAEALRQWMLSSSWGKPWLILRDAMRLGPNNLREGPKLKAAIQMLAEYGWLTPFPIGTVIDGKARREAWRINHD